MQRLHDYYKLEILSKKLTCCSKEWTLEAIWWILHLFLVYRDNFSFPSHICLPSTFRGWAGGRGTSKCFLAFPGRSSKCDINQRGFLPVQKCCQNATKSSPLAVFLLLPYLNLCVCVLSVTQSACRQTIKHPSHLINPFEVTKGRGSWPFTNNSVCKSAYCRRLHG